MNIRLITLVILGLLFSNSGFSKNCPLDNEDQVGLPCSLEQSQVEGAMIGLSVARQYNYCRTPSPDRKDGVGIQCRTLTFYKDKSGEIDLSFFKLQFVALEVKRTLLHDTYYVKQDNGLYNSYHDEVSDGVLQIDNQLPEWRNVEVIFDKNNFPSYFATFNFPSGNEGEEPIQRLAKISYTPFMASLEIGVDLPADQKSTTLYPVMGPYQTPIENSSL